MIVDRLQKTMFLKLFQEEDKVSISQNEWKFPFWFHLDSLLIFGQYVESETHCPVLININSNFNYNF